MKNVYELIRYDGPNYKFSVGWGYYVTSHIHREIEFGMVLDGTIRILSSGRQWDVHPGEFWVLNPCQCHEFTVARADTPYAFLELQIPTSFFREYFPQADRIRFADVVLTAQGAGEENYTRLWRLLFASALRYFAREENYELTCTGDVNYLLDALLRCAPHALLSPEELRASNARMPRVQRMADYIEEHCGEKLLLGDLARREGLSLSYMSHFFRDNFSMPFQTYLQHVRCHRAGVMLVETELSPTEISFACGFSALKYMNQGFRALFGCTPAQYRALLRKEAKRSPARQRAARPPMESGAFEIIFHPDDSAAYLRASRYLPRELGGGEGALPD